jgi:malate synthase
VAINNLMEDAATAEIARSQVWQWLYHDVVLDDTGEPVTRELVERIADEEIAALGDDPGRYTEARALFMAVAVPGGAADGFVDFLTLPAYERMP